MLVRVTYSLVNHALQFRIGYTKGSDFLALNSKRFVQCKNNIYIYTRYENYKTLLSDNFNERIMLYGTNRLILIEIYL